jgi:hypothetical protein
MELCEKDQAIAEVDSDKATLVASRSKQELLLKQKKVML